MKRTVIVCALCGSVTSAIGQQLPVNVSGADAIGGLASSPAPLVEASGYYEIDGSVAIVSQSFFWGADSLKVNGFNPATPGVRTGMETGLTTFTAARFPNALAQTPADYTGIIIFDIESPNPGRLNKPRVSGGPNVAPTQIELMNLRDRLNMAIDVWDDVFTHPDVRFGVYGAGLPTAIGLNEADALTLLAAVEDSGDPQDPLDTDGLFDEFDVLMPVLYQRGREWEHGTPQNSDKRCDTLAEVVASGGNNSVDNLGEPYKTTQLAMQYALELQHKVALNGGDVGILPVLSFQFFGPCYDSRPIIEYDPTLNSTIGPKVELLHGTATVSPATDFPKAAAPLTTGEQAAYPYLSLPWDPDYSDDILGYSYWGVLSGLDPMFGALTFVDFFGHLEDQMQSPCRKADANDDGSLSGSDFNAFLTAFAAQEREGDQNMDGAFTGADFNAHLTNFVDPGCSGSY